mmetsp:Transcript_1946/g.1404  ORF Transcript_1946/g.1404 Transcript_1946/m.1404 type:complete len:163 (+) Transcript_1946:447-935(+)
MEILLMCSLLCSSDVVAAVACVRESEQPKLFAIVFGEGITNDAVSLILFNAVYQYCGPGSEFTTITPLLIGWRFCVLTVCSTATGVVFAMISSLCFKYIRFISHNAIIETAMVFCFAYLSYVMSELCGWSGIMTLLTSGILMAHYTWYNLSEDARKGSSLAF